MTRRCLAVALTGVCSAMAIFAASKTVELKNAQGQSVGTATITENKGGKGVTIRLNLKNLPPGTYTIEAWHEAYRAQDQTVVIGPKESKAISFAFRASDGLGD